ncbi:MAG: TRAP transporter small permease [Rhodospirillales bacterium]|jgi:TRAP-type C4-dicarboxylate transport system permease small subunit
MSSNSRDRGPSNLFEWAIYYLGAALMLAMTGSMVYVVVMRYFFNSPPIWSEDIPKLLFIWMVFLTVGLAIRMGLNIRVTALTGSLPRRARLWLAVVMHLLVLVFLLVLLAGTKPVIELALGGRMLSTGWSNAVYSIPLAIGAGLAFAYQARELWLVVRALFFGGPDPTGPDDTGLGSGVGLG